MVKKAEKIRSMDKLNVSPRTLSYLLRNFSVEDAIRYGRNIAYTHGIVKSPKWEAELTQAIKELGLIRPNMDFSKTLNIGYLYATVFLDKNNFTWKIGQLSNEQYENFVGLSDIDIKKVRTSLSDQLSKKEFLVIWRLYGLDGDDYGRDYESVAQYFRVTVDYIRNVEESALKELRRKNTLPVVFDAPTSLNNAIDDLKKEIDELHDDPIFKKEHELLMKLENMKKLPLRYSDADDRHRCTSKASDTIPIEMLNLGTRSYNCLKHAGINTISEVINYPRDSWYMVRNLDRRDLEELIWKMNAAGYDFNISTKDEQILS